MITRTATATRTATRTATITAMTDPAPIKTDAEAAQVLHQWFSPAFPVGGFAYSHGLETAIAQGQIASAQDLRLWLEGLLAHGAGRMDAVLMAHAWRADAQETAALADLASALCPSAERRLETEAQGEAFARTVSALYGLDLPAMPYPVALGRAARLIGLPLAPLLQLALQGFAANLVSAAVRLVPLGQTEGQGALTALLPLCARLATGAETADLDEVGSMALAGDIASMRHEVQSVRLFRS